MGPNTFDLKRKVIHFLTTDPAIAKIDFTFLGRYRITPNGYRRDVAGAIFRGDIIIGNHVTGGAGASYRPETDSLELQAQKPGDPDQFATPSFKAILLHECTHAQLDMQRLGEHPFFEEEAAAYTAEALYTIHAGTHISFKQAPKIEESMYKVANAILQCKSPGHEATDMKPLEAALIAAIRQHPHYHNKPGTLDSNGFDRSAWHNLQRNHPALYRG